MVSKNILLSFILHLILAGALFFVLYQKTVTPTYVPFEVQLDSVHVHHYENQPKSKAETGISKPKKHAELKPEPAPEPEKPSSAASSDHQPTGGPQAIASATSRYLSQLLQIISRQKFYPKASLLNEESGVVEVRLTLDSNGGLLHSEIKKSSGFSNLDAAALKTLQSISSFPPPPTELGSPLNISVPIRYEINPDHP